MPLRFSTASWSAPATITSAQSRPCACVTSSPAASSAWICSCVPRTRTSFGIAVASEDGAMSTSRKVTRASRPAPCPRQPSATIFCPAWTHVCATSLPPKPLEVASLAPRRSRSAKSQSPLPRRRALRKPDIGAR